MTDHITFDLVVRLSREDALKAAVRQLNEAAYVAARLANRLQDTRAAALRRIALDTDQIIDGVRT